jgi:hypothetical protein
MSSLWTTHCDSFMLIDHVSHERAFASQKAKGTKSIQSNLHHPDLLSFVLPSQEYEKILLRLYYLLAKNGRKSHRYRKKTVFDILGVVYEYTMSHKIGA